MHRNMLDSVWRKGGPGVRAAPAHRGRCPPIEQMGQVVPLGHAWDTGAPGWQRSWVGQWTYPRTHVPCPGV